MLRRRPDRPVEGEPLRGWRAWQVVEGEKGPVLASWWLHTRWPAREALVARCSVHGTRPALHHVCGIHAFGACEHALAYIRRRPREPLVFSPRVDRALGVVIGAVSGWGRAVMHARGWRCQYAYPYDLYLLAGDRGLARELADRYAVETSPFPPALQ
jgi:hypothetical protein